MQSWNAIVHTAMMGTDKKTIGAAEVDSHLAEAAALIENNTALNREEKFLQLAALTLNYRLCCVLPLQKETIDLKAAVPEELPYCSPAATQSLKDIMEEDVVSLLHAWLNRCVRARQIAWPESLPALLAEGARQKKWQSLVFTVCGKRGEWLAGFNENWNYPVSQSDDQTWQTGTPEQRKILFQQLRVTDRRKAMELLRQTWPTEDLNTKLGLLELMTTGIASDDIPFLESLSGEKSKKIKDLVLQLMKRIAGSPVVILYEELLKQSVSVKKEKGLLGIGAKTVLEFHLPDTISEDVFKSGIDKLSPDKKISDHQYILSQLIANVPPAFWEGICAMPVEEIIKAFNKTDEGKALFQAVGLAVGQFKDRQWAAQLLEYDGRLHLNNIPLLDLPLRDKFIQKHFAQAPDEIINLCAEDEQEWSPAVAQLILRHSSGSPYQYNKAFFNRIIHLIPFQMEPELEGIMPAEEHLKGYWSNTRDHLRKLLLLKSQLNKAFNN